MSIVVDVVLPENVQSLRAYAKRESLGAAAVTFSIIFYFSLSLPVF